jgi:hypothetical protein
VPLDTNAAYVLEASDLSAKCPGHYTPSVNNAKNVDKPFEKR